MNGNEWWMNDLMHDTINEWWINREYMNEQMNEWMNNGMQK